MSSPSPINLLRLMPLLTIAGVVWIGVVLAWCELRGGPVEATGVVGAVASGVGLLVFGAATLVTAYLVGSKIRAQRGLEPRCVHCGHRVGESFRQARAYCCPECGANGWDDRRFTPPFDDRVEYAILAHQVLGTLMLAAGIFTLLILVPAFAGADC